MDIGKNLRIIRTRANKSQQEAADYVGVERKTYMSWEAGTTRIKSDYLPILAKFFDVDINEFFQESPSNIVITQNNSDNKDNSVNSVIILLNDKEAIDELVRIFTKKKDNNSS